MLLLAHLTANPGAVLLLDEPDAHLEILRQRRIYQLLSETAENTGSQIIAAGHSEVILNEAADRDVLISFVGKPHRVDNRGSQVVKALREIGFEHYLLSRRLNGSGRSAGPRPSSEPSGGDWSLTMDESITEMEHALETLGKPAPWGPDIKASDDFLDRLFKRFYEKRALPNLMTKTDYHRPAGFVDEKHIDPEIREKLDALTDAAGRARPRECGPG